MIKPQFKITAREERSDYGKFVIKPLEQGYGVTIGNALRRCLLTSLPGAAVVEVEIDGARHQFTTLVGAREDIVELILNIKQLRVKYSGEKEVKLTLEAVGPKTVTAKDIKAPAEVEIVNKDLVLANLADRKSSLKMKLKVKTGLGYLSVEERKVTRVGVIPVDALFTPVQRVNFQVQSTRVGRRIDFDKLTMEVWTDGSIAPKQTIEDAATILVGYFKQIYKPTFAKKKEVKDQLSFKDQELLNLTVEELDLPTRIANALRKGGYKTVKNLKQAKKSEISKVKNLGSKSVETVVKVLKEKGIEIGG